MDVIDPWATDRPVEPRSLNREDRIEAAAEALMLTDYEWSTDTWADVARIAIQAAYPELGTTAAELDALPFGAVLIGPGGIAYERVVEPDNTLVDPDRCWAQQAWTTTRISSAGLVRNGEVYVLVHRSQP